MEPIGTEDSIVSTYSEQPLVCDIITEVENSLSQDSQDKILDLILIYLNSGGPSEHRERQNALGSSNDFIHNILQILDRKTSPTKTRRKVFTILQLLCHFDENDRYSGNNENITRLGDNKRSKIIVAALTIHISNAEIVRTHYIPLLAEILKMHSLTEGFIALEIMHFLYHQEESADIIYIGCDVIRIMGLYNSRNFDELISAGAAEALIGAVNVHIDNPKVVAEGCEVR